MVFAPWLIVLLVVALVPAFLGEAHFNAQSTRSPTPRTPERREIDYVRQTGASVETAKEVKIFGLSAFLIERYRRLAEDFYRANRRLAMPRRLGRRCSPRSARSATTSPMRYLAWRTVRGPVHDRRPDLPGRLLRAPARPARGC